MNVFPINIDITSCNMDGTDMDNPRLRLYTAIKNNLQNAQ